MKLSRNLSLSEMTKSNTATRLGISNQPTDEHVSNMKELAVNIFQPIREHFGSPIYISSGYRGNALNKAINGSKSSQHCKGEAIDIDMDYKGGPSNADVFTYIKDNLKFDQLIWEFGTDNNPNWVHVSYDTEGAQRKQILIAYKNDKGKTKYKFYE
jgi:hypothetical protein